MWSEISFKICLYMSVRARKGDEKMVKSVSAYTMKIQGSGLDLTEPILKARCIHHLYPPVVGRGPEIGGSLEITGWAAC